jgi:hypothetical protein
MPHPQILDATKIITFPPLGERGRRITRHDDAERGTILLFTGVRYERIEDDADEAVGDAVQPCRRDEIWS